MVYCHCQQEDIICLCPAFTWLPPSIISSFRDWHRNHKLKTLFCSVSKVDLKLTLAACREMITHNNSKSGNVWSYIRPRLLAHAFAATFCTHITHCEDNHTSLQCLRLLHHRAVTVRSVVHCKCVNQSTGSVMIHCRLPHLPHCVCTQPSVTAEPPSFSKFSAKWNHTSDR